MAMKPIVFCAFALASAAGAGPFAVTTVAFGPVAGNPGAGAVSASSPRLLSPSATTMFALALAELFRRSSRVERERRHGHELLGAIELGERARVVPLVEEREAFLPEASRGALRRVVALGGHARCKQGETGGGDRSDETTHVA